MPDFKKEWLAKASIDFFAPFVNLWLACNSWYKSYYAEVGNKDRELINKIKSDFSLRNHLYTKFKDVIDKPSQVQSTDLIIDFVRGLLMRSFSELGRKSRGRCQ